MASAESALCAICNSALFVMRRLSLAGILEETNIGQRSPVEGVSPEALSYAAATLLADRVVLRVTGTDAAEDDHKIHAKNSFQESSGNCSSKIRVLFVNSLPYRHLLELSDGGEVAIDWVENDTRSPHPRATRPTVLIMPGLIGSGEENYALHLVDQTSRRGYRSVIFNNRGLGGAQLKTPRTYCATNTEDLAEVIAYVKQKYPQAPLIGVGISLGGLILTHFMTETGKQCPLVAGMTFSAPWNVYESNADLDNYVINDLIFNRHLTQGLKASVKRNEEFFRDIINLEKVYKSRTIREFDDAFTTVQFGYDSCKEYYKAACTHKKVHQVAAPLLCLNAADDPFSPGRAIPIDEANASKYVAIVKTIRGGHIGFLDGLFPRHASYMDRLFAEYVDAIFQNLDEVKAITMQ